MKGLKRMEKKSHKKEEYELSCTRRRIGSLLMDYLVWYILHICMTLILYISKYGVPKVSDNLMYYKDAFDSMIKTPIFSLTYLGIICIWEIVIPLITNGQSLSKKVFKIRIITLNGSRMILILRSIVKIIILNPYGVIAYIIGNIIGTSYTNIISNVLSVIFIISIILVLKNKKSLHDRIAKTSVELV